MTASEIVALAVAIGLIPLAGAFSAVDSGLARVSVARIDEFIREGVRGAKTLRQLAVDRARYTSLLLLLRMVCELTSVVLVTIVARTRFGHDWLVTTLTVAVMVIVTYVFVGVGPRTIGRQHPYRACLPVAGIVRLLGKVFGPLASFLIVLGNAVTPGKGFREGPFSSEVELRELVDMAESRGVVEHGEREMIQSVFELGDTIAREVMVPRTEVVFVERAKQVPQALALCVRSGFSRIPVTGENLDEIVGVAYLKDLALRAQAADGAKNTEVESVMRRAVFVPESKPVDELLREMQAHRTHIAIVIDEYGGTAGLVTIEDILEEIVGEIADEHDANERPPVERLDDGAVRVTARLLVEDLADLFDVEFPDRDDVETVAGLLADTLGRVPIPGAHAEVGGLLLTAESITGRRNRIDTVLVRPVIAADADDSNASQDDEPAMKENPPRTREPRESAKRQALVEPR